jgi:HK97 family phage prohead protease
VEKQTLATVTSPAATGDEPTITITTVALDRALDEVVPEGGDFAAYLRNPVVLYGHDHNGLPVGATTQLDVTPGRGIRARWRWLEGDPVADRVRNAFEQGMLRAASIGFVPREGERNGRGGPRFLKWELVEWSLCAVPANPEAVRVLRSLDLWPDPDGEEVLDVDMSTFTPEELGRLGRGAGARRLRRGEPWGDPAAHEVLDLDPGDVRRVIADVVPAMLRRALAEQRAVVERGVRAALLRARGRVD